MQCQFSQGGPFGNDRTIGGTAVNATNTLGTTGRVEAYARTANGGLAIYAGGDFWFTFGATSHLKLVFDDMLAQAFNPDGLPCTNPSSGIKLDPATSTNPLGASHTDTATVVDINAKPLGRRPRHLQGHQWARRRSDRDGYD